MKLKLIPHIYFKARKKIWYAVNAYPKVFLFWSSYPSSWLMNTNFSLSFSLPSLIFHWIWLQSSSNPRDNRHKGTQNFLMNEVWIIQNFVLVFNINLLIYQNVYFNVLKFLKIYVYISVPCFYIICFEVECIILLSLIFHFWYIRNCISFF